MKLVTFYEIMKWDGGDRHYPTGICFKSEYHANQFLADNCNTVDNCDLRQFQVFEDSIDYKQNNALEIKKRALDKLTAEEKVALKLNKDQLNASV